jgi:hypothetical protein
MAVTPKDIQSMSTAYANAWSSQDAAAVAAHYEPNGQIAINGDAALVGTEAVTEMAAGFHAAFPDMKLMCDGLRVSGNHALFLWTFYGHHFETKNFVRVSGWEEWTISNNCKVQSSLGWFDLENYEAQIAGKAN